MNNSVLTQALSNHVRNAQNYWAYIPIVVAVMALKTSVNIGLSVYMRDEGTTKGRLEDESVEDR